MALLTNIGCPSRDCLAAPPAKPVQHVVVTVADRVADADGLWPVDFTLLSTAADARPRSTSSQPKRCWPPASSSVSTPRCRAWRRCQARRAYSTVVVDRGAAPRLVVPDADGAVAIPARDREDELAHVARRLKAARRSGARPPLHEHALIVRRPLPYLYLARVGVRRRRRSLRGARHPAAGRRAVRCRPRPGARLRSPADSQRSATDARSSARRTSSSKPCGRTAGRSGRSARSIGRWRRRAISAALDRLRALWQTAGTRATGQHRSRRPQQPRAAPPGHGWRSRWRAQLAPLTEPHRC